ncbi:MAG: hypothetical protein HY078_09135 [Elusimicrobia bacterium]|nr:hypothetical protein [Elusimicrobiota bacterium]
MKTVLAVLGAPSLSLCVCVCALAEATAPGAWPPAEAARFAEEVDRIVKNHTVRSSIPPVVTPIAPSLADFLLDHPDLSSAVVRKHRIAPYRIEMRGPSQSDVDDGAGISGLVTLAEKRPDRRVYLAEGVYANRVFPGVRAAAAIIMKTKPVERPGCPPGIRTEFDVYVTVRNPLLSSVVKALRPFLRKTISRKFSKAILVAHNTAMLLAKDPEGMTKELLAYPQLSAEARAVAQRELGRLKDLPASCLTPP